jgi:autoinducer 2-degrading protein
MILYNPSINGCDRQGQGSGDRGYRAKDHHDMEAKTSCQNLRTSSRSRLPQGGEILLLAHKARLKDEAGTLQFEVLLPKDDDTKVLSYEMYRDAAAFEAHLHGPSLAQLLKETAGTVMKLHGVRCAVVD